MPNKEDNSKKKILLVEDDIYMSKALSFKLAQEGFEVRTLFNGENVLAKIDEESFNLFLLDLIMPKVDGWQVLKDIHYRHITTPVMVVSNLGQPEDIERARELGAVEYFVKSVSSLSDIAETIKNFFNPLSLKLQRTKK